MLDLIERAQQGDREAFGTLAVSAIDRLYAIAVRVVHDRDRAEDAVQSALMQAWRDIRSLRDPGRFDAWLYRFPAGLLRRGPQAAVVRANAKCRFDRAR
jgi:RNA polymerase sigma-70 factor (ECF subfamily)